MHNGTLENVEELREELKELGINLVSKTDTEVNSSFLKSKNFLGDSTIYWILYGPGPIFS